MPTITALPDVNASGISDSSTFPIVAGGITSEVTLAELRKALDANPTPNTVTPGLRFYNVKTYGAAGDGVTNDTVAIDAAIAAMPASGAVLYFPNAVYRIDADSLYGLLFVFKDNFAILGNGSTIKVLDGEACATQFNMMTFQYCTDGFIDNLFLDGNRANRSINFGTPDGAYPLQVQDGCARLLFNNVRSINSPIDAFSVIVASAQFANLPVYPTDITFRDCLGDNAVRCGMAPINSNRLRVIGGRYQNTNGSAPECGIDLEPDAGFTSFGNTDPQFLDVEASTNTGVGFQVSGPSTALNTNVTITGFRGRDNVAGFMSIGQCDGLDLDFICGPHATATRGLVDINSLATGVRIKRGTFEDITASAAGNSCIYVHTAVPDTPEINNVSFKRVSCSTMVLNRRTIVDGYSALLCTMSPEIGLVAGPSVIRNAVSESSTGISLYIDAPDVTVDGFSSVDCAHTSYAIYLASTAARSTMENIKVEQRTSIPAGQKAINYDVIPGVLSNLSVHSAGADYTTANAYLFTAGIAGSQISGLKPGPIEVSADRGDTNQTLVYLIDANIQRWATVLTGNKTVTLSATNAALGSKFRIVRTGLGAFTLDVGGLKTIPSGTAAFVDVAHDGTAWRLTGYGAL